MIGRKVKLVTYSLQNTNIEMRIFPIRLQEQGQITVPQVIQDKLIDRKRDFATTAA